VAEADVGAPARSGVGCADRAVRVVLSAHEMGYSDGFVSHYIMPIIYPAGLTRGLEIAIGLVVLVINLGIYVKVFR
jgi:hypothetical protein